MDLITFTIDGKSATAWPGSTVLETAKRLGIRIPTLCHYEGLSPYGACRVCIVEVVRAGRSRLEASCVYPVEKGIEVLTNSPKVLAARRLIVELLYARCPNVPVIKSLAKELGVDKPRFKMGDDNCILCGLCVRVCEEVVGVAALSFVNRGTKREVSTPFGAPAETCIACGACAVVCPTGAIVLEEAEERVQRELPLGPNKPIHVQFPNAVPNVPAIDPETCIYFTTGGCKICEKFCEAKAINHSMQPEQVEVEVGTIVLATGHDFFNAGSLPQYNYGVFPNIITSIEFERMCNAAGPTGGKIQLVNGEKPKTICFIHCVGCRDHHANTYCSRLCCMHAMKQALLAKEKTGADVYELYIDIRAGGNYYEEFYERVQREGVIFIRGRGAEVMMQNKQLLVKAEDTGMGRPIILPVDMVVLVTGLVPRSDAAELAKIVRVTRNSYGFFMEAHPKLRPFNTNTEGIYIAGTCQGPKDIPDTIAHASAAAAEALALMGKGKVTIEPVVAEINEAICGGCKICIQMCPYGAISFDESRRVSSVNAALCKGCGSCAAACPSGAATVRHFRDEQIMAEIEGLLGAPAMEELGRAAPAPTAVPVETA